MTINQKVQAGNLFKTDLHMHTIYCDGKNTPEEMVLEAIRKGFECIGFSGHSYVEFDQECGMDETDAALYLQEISRLREIYRSEIRIFCGVEQDDCSLTSTAPYDYVIGSVHYLRIPRDGGFAYAPVDNTPEELAECAEMYFGNDYYAVAENYFEAVSQVCARTRADIIGHFDLVSKFNEKHKLFDEQHPRYIAAWKKAADRLLAQGKVFEINTGGMARGWRSVPYPAPEMIAYIRDRGGRFILSGDSHRAEQIGYRFEEMAQYLS